MADTVSAHLPDEFLDRLRGVVPQDTYDRILAAYSVVRPTTFRANTLKSTADELEHALAGRFLVSRVPWYGDAFVMERGDLRSLTETPEYSEGRLYVQSLSSMIPTLVLDPHPGDKVLDITAAPGSKSTQIAAMMGNSGDLVVNDSSHVRIYRLKANLALQGVTNSRVIQQDARSLWQKYPEYFDKTLVDVPCSMEGRFRTDEPKSYADWSVKKVKELSHLQRWILRSGISATKPGGIIVYSTCTLSPEENEEVIDWILTKEKGHLELEQVSVSGFDFDSPQSRWGSKVYDPSLSRTGRIHPTERMEGFFVAKIRKTASTVRG